MNKSKKPPKPTQTDMAEEEGVSQPTISRRLARGDLQHRLDVALAREREAKAKLREMEVERESGKYIESAIVKADAADTRERVVAVLRSIPQRCAMALECPCQRAAVVKTEIAKEIERALAEIRDSRFAGERVK